MKNTSLNSKNYTLTKTKITSGLQCHKKLWFDFHEPIKDKDNFIFHLGNRFGEIVRKNYGKGLDLSDNFDIRDAVDLTKKAINSNNINVIYEGAFIYQDTLVRTDVLMRRKIGWELLEAKSSTRLKDEHIPDIAIQSFIVKLCGVDLSSIKLIHINKEFTYKGNKNYNNLIKENEITGEVISKEKEVINYIKKFKPLADKNSSCPNISMGEHCNKPYPCDYQDRCKSLLPKSNLTSYEILPYIKKNKYLIKYMKEKGTKDLQKVPAEFFKNRSDYAPGYHKKIQDAHKNNNSWINKDLKNVFKDFSFPFYFIDFETVNQGVPIIKGTQPYYPLPFQWSVHKWESKDKQIDKGQSFLKFDDQNIERQFIESLLKAVGKKGTIFAHNAKSTEIKILEKFKEKDNCKDLSDKIDNLINRVEDSLIIARKNFYSPLMNGDWGIKSIVKAIPNCEINYEEKGNIGGGTDAQLAWFICTDKNTLKTKKQKQSDLLVKYCSKDTLAIYHLMKHLINLRNK